MRNTSLSGRRPRPVMAWTPLESLEPRRLLAMAVWDGGATGLGTNWHDPQNWKADVVPADGDDVTIGAGPAIEYSSGTVQLHTIASARSLRLTGGVLGLTTSGTVGDVVTLDGGAISGGSWTFTGPGIVVTAAAGNALHGASFIGHMELAVESAFVRVTGGLTVTGLISISGDLAAISFDSGNQSFGGVVDVVFSGFELERYISADSGAQLTIAPTVRISGDRGAIVSGRFGGAGSGVVVNQGTIWSDVAGGTLDVRPSLFTNLGTLRASNFAYLRVGAGSWTNAGVISTVNGFVLLAGTFDVTGGVGVFTRSGGEVLVEGTVLNTGATLAFSAATGTWRFNGGRILGGTVTVSPAWFIGDYPSASGKFVGVTVIGDMAWQNGNYTGEFDAVTYHGNFTFGSASTLIVRNTLTFNGTLTVTGTNTLIQFAGGSQPLLGNVIVQLRNEDAFFWSNYILTIPSTATISGFGHLLGSFVNQGTVVADTPGKVLLIGEGDFVNENIVAAAGGKLTIGLHAGSAANFINNGTVNAGGGATLAIGPTLGTGPVLFENNGETTLLGGSHLIVGATFAIRPVTVTNNGTVVIAEGSDGKFGDLTAFTLAKLINAGTISVEGGSLFSFETDATTAELGDIRAAGGTVRIRGDVNNSNATLTMDSESGSWMVDGGTISGGSISFQDGAQLLFNSNLANRLQGVTIQGAMSLSGTGARLAVGGGLTVNGSMVISGDGAVLWFDVGEQSLSGVGTISLAGSQGVQTISADRGATVTVGAGVSIVGLSGDGRLAAGVVGGGIGSFVNMGTISGKLRVNTTSFMNAGTVEARDGHTLEISSPVTNLVGGTLTGGTWKVSGASRLEFGQTGVVVNDAAVVLDGVGAEWAGLASLETNRGSLSLRSGATLSVSGALFNGGTVSVRTGATLNAASYFQSKRGVLEFYSSTGGVPHLNTTGPAWLFGTISVVWVGMPASGAYSFIQGATVNADYQALSVQAPGAGLGHLVVSNSSVFRIVVYRLGRP